MRLGQHQRLGKLHVAGPSSHHARLSSQALPSRGSNPVCSMSATVLIAQQACLHVGCEHRIPHARPPPHAPQHLGCVCQLRRGNGDCRKAVSAELAC